MAVSVIDLAGGRVTLHGSDCLDVLRTLPEASVDSVVTDPPYHLTSVVRRFGGTSAAPAQFGTDGAVARASRGFMGKEWDGGDVAFRPETWAEVLRVLKPGGHLVAFSATRTYHRMACAVEDAGFDIRDMIAWLSGSGFPKSHDVSKAIDKAAGADREVTFIKYRAPAGSEDPTQSGGRNYRMGGEQAVTSSATDAARQWEGWGTALKPALEPLVFARKPLAEGTIAANVLAHGTGALNIDDCRIGTSAGDQEAMRRVVGYNKSYSDGEPSTALSGGADGSLHRRDRSEFDPTRGRWPANVCHDGSDEVVAAFPRSKGAVSNGSKGNDAFSGGWKARGQTPSYNDDGSAARFFFSAKARKADRAGSKHPTVKPVALMRWLARLITPPGGVVLDPFAGSGTTGAAALAEGFRAVLIEREAEYQADIVRRLSAGGDLADDPEPGDATPDRSGTLFGWAAE